jgi:hypothetical protein
LKDCDLARLLTSPNYTLDAMATLLELDCSPLLVTSSLRMSMCTAFIDRLNARICTRQLHVHVPSNTDNWQFELLLFVSECSPTTKVFDGKANSQLRISRQFHVSRGAPCVTHSFSIFTDGV